MHLDGWGFADAQQIEAVEILVDHGTVFDLYSLIERRAQAIEHGPLDLVDGARGIDDLPAHIDGGPDLMDLRSTVRGYAGLDHFCGISKMAVTAGNAHADAFWQ